MEQSQKKPFPMEKFIENRNKMIDDFVNNGGYERHLRTAVDMDTREPILMTEDEVLNKLERVKSQRNSI